MFRYLHHETPPHLQLLKISTMIPIHCKKSIDHHRKYLCKTKTNFFFLEIGLGLQNSHPLVDSFTDFYLPYEKYFSSTEYITNTLSFWASPWEAQAPALLILSLDQIWSNLNMQSI